MPVPSRRARLAWLSTAAFLVAATALAPVGSARSSLPDVIAATGDSLTRAAGTGFWPWQDNPAGSWSTGTDGYVNSHYLRLLELTPRIQGRNYNDARSGAKMAELASQMDKAVSQRADYVTVIMGGNDICSRTEAGMTPVADYETQFRAAMERVTTARPSVRVFVGSIPNIYRLWEILKDDAAARFAWDLLDVCQSLLANPLSTDAADVARRERVLRRIIDFNAVLQRVCEEFRQCRHDRGAIFEEPFKASDAVRWDYFHPSLQAQRKIAAGTWRLSWWGG